MDNENNAPKGSGVTVGAKKQAIFEAGFWLSGFTGLLHFAGINLQLAGMFAHTTLKRELALPFTASTEMLQVYLATLAIYAGGKEIWKWKNRSDEEILSDAESRRISRGFYIVAGWTVYTVLVIFCKSMGLIAEVPGILMNTLYGVLSVFFGTEVSRHMRAGGAKARQDAVVQENYGDRTLDYCREKGSISRLECENEFGLNEDQALRLLQRLVREKKLVETGEKKNRRYKLP
jgi:hypothetical protein